MSQIKYLEWNWKDGSRREWKLTANPSGEVKNVDDAFNPDGDVVWYWYLYDEDAINTGIAQNYTWAGSLVGQYDLPPRLESFLLNWLEDVNRIVVDGACDETRKRWSDVNGSK